MLSSIKSWVYADLLVKPEELVLFKSRQKGGLNLIHIKYRAMAELIKTFLDTAINPIFRRNIYHQALYDWHVEEIRSIPNPGTSPYYSEELFEEIKSLKSEGLLRLSSMTSGMWYKVLLERHVTHEINDGGFRFEIRTKAEMNNQAPSWEMSWSLHKISGLDSEDSSFLFCLLHNLLPTQERLHRVLGSNTVASPTCILCTQNVVCDQIHALILCPFNNNITSWVIRSLRNLLPNLKPPQLLSLDLGIASSDENALPATWFAGKSLHIVWQARVKKKAISIAGVRAVLEAGVMILRKTRFHAASATIESLISNN